MRVVVTGAAGFIGSHVVDRLLEDGAVVDAIDDLSGGSSFTPETHGRAGVEAHRLQVGASSATDADALSDLIAGADLVMHLASPIGVGLAHSRPDEVARSILDAGRAVVGSCQTTRTPLVYTSSSEAYGVQGGGALSESTPPRFTSAPRWAYGRAKLAVESMARGAGCSGLPVWIARLFNVVGARQRPDTGLVVPSFCAAALDGRPIRIHGDGSAVRSFVDVSAVVDGLLRLPGHRALRSRPVNLGGSEAVRIDTLAEIVRATVAPVPIVRTPPSEHFGRRFADVRCRVPDLRLATRWLDWRPSVDITDSVLACAATIDQTEAERAG